MSQTPEKTATESSSSDAASPERAERVTYAALRSRIEADRLRPWSSTGDLFKIGPFTVQPLSMRSWVDLELADNGLLTGDFTDEDLVFYTWRHHPDYKPGADDALYAFARTFQKASPDMAEIAEHCLEHFAAAFTETPEGASYGGTAISYKMAAVPAASALCDEAAAAYGKDPREVADWPLALLFQQIRAIRQRLHRMGQGPKYDYPEPKELRDAAAKLLK